MGWVHLPVWMEDSFPVIIGEGEVLQAVRSAVAADDAAARIRFVEYIGQPPAAFQVLADVTRLFRTYLSEHLTEIRYLKLRPDYGDNAPDAAPAEADAISWQHDPSGEVQAFRLPPLIASSPLLPWLVQELNTKSLDDARCFATLTAAFSEN